MYKRLYWLVENRVLVTEYTKHVTTEDMRHAAPFIADELKKHAHPEGIHLVLDATHVTSFDRSIFNLTEVREINSIIHEHNTFLSNPVIYPHSFPMVIMVLNLISRLFRPQIVLVTNWQHLVEYLLNLDPTLEGLLKLPESEM